MEGVQRISLEGKTFLIPAAPLRRRSSRNRTTMERMTPPAYAGNCEQAGYFQPARPGKPQECFVDQGCRVEQGHAPASQEPGMREWSKLPVQQREKLLVMTGGPFHSSLNPFVDFFRS